jgi:hypothetical protein
LQAPEGDAERGHLRAMPGQAVTPVSGAAVEGGVRAAGVLLRDEDGVGGAVRNVGERSVPPRAANCGSWSSVTVPSAPTLGSDGQRKTLTGSEWMSPKVRLWLLPSNERW